MKKILHRFTADIKAYWLPLLLTAIIFVGLKIIFNEVCPVKIIWGVECPGCGLTHSCIYILTLHWRLAWESNPTGFLWFISIFLWLWFRYIIGRECKGVNVLFVISALTSLFIKII